MKSVFSTYHPAVNFGFFCAVIGIGMFMMHPVYLVIGMGAALTYALMLGGKDTLKFFVFFILPMTLVFAVVNALVNPRGETVLFYTEYSQVTMEAAVYGLMMGLLLGTVLLWFSCYNNIMTSDKFVYLFGKIIPAVSLIFSMVMRFVPSFKRQIRKISDAQKCIGQNVTDGSIKKRIKSGISIISAMFTWALERSIDSADSMRSRGYGLKGRSTFSIHRFDRRDGFATVFMGCMVLTVIAGMCAGKSSIEFYPKIVMAMADGGALAAYAAYFCLCFFPAAAEIREVIIWRRLRSEI